MAFTLNIELVEPNQVEVGKKNLLLSASPYGARSLLLDYYND